MTKGPNYWTWTPGGPSSEEDLSYEGPRVLTFKAPPFGEIFALLDAALDAQRSVKAPQGSREYMVEMLPTYEAVLKAAVWPRPEGVAVNELQDEYTFVEIIQAFTAALGGLHEQVAFLPAAEAKAAKDLPFTEPPTGGTATS